MIYIWINTYNRPNELDNLLSDIERDINSKYVIRIYNDGSVVDYDPVLDKYHYLNIKYTMTENHGKKKYWQLLNLGMNDIKNESYDYCIRLDDDVRLAEGFFEKAINVWEGISHPDKVSLFPLLDSREGQSVWTGHQPVLIKDEKIYDCGWVDDMYVCQSKFFEELDFNIPMIPMSRWRNNPNLSTGTGRYISRTLHDKGLKMYLVTETLVHHHERDKKHPSVMNPRDHSES